MSDTLPGKFSKVSFPEVSIPTCIHAYVRIFLFGPTSRINYSKDSFPHNH